MERLVDSLTAKGPLRTGMVPARATDVLDFLMGPESYAELVLRSCWPPRLWVPWVAETLNEQLFGTHG